MKDFLLLANVNAITYKEFFPLLKDNNVRLGYTPTSGGMDMYAGPNFDPGKKKVKYDENGNMIVNIEGVCWYTTLPTPDKRKLILTKKYHHELYPHYDHYRAIYVDKVRNIPKDYDCFMAVPISILQYDLTNFVIADARDHTNVERLKNKSTQLIKDGDGTINGKAKYCRVLIRIKRSWEK